ncbi:hypothetical protein CH373_18490, partial [Leptospira perolatii]
DSSLTGDARSNAKGALSGFRTSYDTGSKEWNPILTLASAPFGSLDVVFSNFGQSIQAFRSSLENRSGIGQKVSADLLSLYDGFNIEYEGRKAELQFLLDANGSSDSLNEIIQSAKEKRNLEGAQINEKALSLFESTIKGLDPEDRNVDAIYLKILKDSDDRFTNLQLGPNALQERKAMELVLDFVRTNRSSLDRSLQGTDYNEFVNSITKQLSSAGKITEFYEDGGELTEAERNSIRENGSSDERRELNEYYTFGSTFFFGKATNQVAALGAIVERLEGFAGNVRSGGILSAIKEDYFRTQENKTTGLLNEIHNGVSGLGGLTASDLLQDSFSLGTSTDHDTEAESLRKNLLSDLLSGKTSESEFLEALEDLDKLGTIFSAQERLKVYAQASNFTEEWNVRSGDLTNSMTNLTPLLGGVNDAPDSLLGFMTNDLRDWYSSRVTDITNFYNLKDLTNPLDVTQPAYPGVDFTGLESYITNMAPKLAQWDAQKAGLETARQNYVTENTKLSALTLGSPEYFAQIEIVSQKLHELNAAYQSAKTYFMDISSDSTTVYQQGKSILTTMKSSLGLPNKFLVNDASLAIMPEGVRNDYNN